MERWPTSENALLQVFVTGGQNLFPLHQTELESERIHVELMQISDRLPGGLKPTENWTDELHEGFFGS